MIVRAIRNGDPPGRFLKKDEKSGKWYDIGDKRAAEKTSQALREKNTDEKDGGVPAAAAPKSPAADKKESAKSKKDKDTKGDKGKDVKASGAAGQVEAVEV